MALCGLCSWETVQWHTDKVGKWGYKPLKIEFFIFSVRKGVSNASVL